MTTVVEDDPKTPLSIATTPKCRGARYSFPWIAPLYPCPRLIVLSAKQGGIKYHFWVFGMTPPGIEPRSTRLLANALTIMPINVYEQDLALNNPQGSICYKIPTNQKNNINWIPTTVPCVTIVEFSGQFDWGVSHYFDLKSTYFCRVFYSHCCRGKSS